MKSFSKHLRHLGAGVVLTGLAMSFSAGIAAAQPWNGPPPPPPRFERHVDRPGFVWEGGHWNRGGNRWVWAPGNYIAVSPGRHWVHGHWRNTPGGRIWINGHWSA
jgi:hypothetical protein